MDTNQNDYTTVQASLAEWNEVNQTKFHMSFESRRFDSGSIQTEINIYEFTPYEFVWNDITKQRPSTTIFRGNLSTLISILKKCNL